MKIKHRALALILSAIMVLAYMPALAFAGGEDSADEYYWCIEYTSDSHILPGETAELTAEVSIDEVAYDEAGLAYPEEFSYSWYKQDVSDDGEEEIRIPIEGETGSTFETDEAGGYICVVTDDRGNEEEATFFVWEREIEGGWYAYDVNEGDDYYLSKEGKATLSVMVEPFEGELPDNITYTWYIGTIDGDSPVEGANGPSFEVDEAGEYTCLVSDGTADNDKCVNFRVYEYQEEYSDINWDAQMEEWRYFLQNGSAKLAMHIDYYGEGTPTYTYQWYINGDPINGATGASYVATEAGDYSCKVTINVNGEKDETFVACEVYSWRITNDDQEFPVEYGKSVTLKAETDYKGSATPVYQWGKSTYDPEEGDDAFTPIEGADDASYTVENVTEDEQYLCKVTIDGVSQIAGYYICLDYSNYEYVYPYPNAVAKYETHDNRPLTVKYFYDDEGGYDRCILNFPEADDKIIMTSGDHVDEYVCIDGDNEDDEEDIVFVNVEDENDFLYFDPQHYTADASSGKIKAFVYSESVDHVNKKKIIKYDTEITLSAGFETNVKSIKFEPSTINLYSEDIKEIEGGHSYYYLSNRNKQGDNGAFAAGDKLTVTYEDNSTRVFTCNSYGNFVYADSNGYYDACPEYDDYSLKAGNNTVKLYYQGRVTSINVFMDTPQMRDERARAKAAADAKAKAAADAKAKEAARQGTPDSKIAKVKSSKPSAGKKSVTAKWKKLTSKQLKKGKVKKYEIWVCPNKAFGPSDTIMKEVSKSKSSGKVKVPKKGKYYVKVRAIRKVGGVKYVGKWSSPKKVKVKK